MQKRIITADGTMLRMQNKVITSDIMHKRMQTEKRDGKHLTLTVPSSFMISLFISPTLRTVPKDKRPARLMSPLFCPAYKHTVLNISHMLTRTRGPPD